MVYRGLYSYQQGVHVITVFPNILFVLFLYVEILVDLLHEKRNLHKLSNKHKMWYLKNTT